MPMTDPAVKLIKVGRLIDGVHDVPRPKMAVRIRGDRIDLVCPQTDLAGSPDEAGEVIDLPDCTLLPGLIDCHTHLGMPGNGLSVDQHDQEGDDVHLLDGVRNSRLALATGVTTVRECGGWRNVVFSLKDGIRRGIVPGPRIVACGRPVTITGGHCWMMGSVADGVDEVRKTVRRLVQDGADFIKVMGSGGSTKGSAPERASYTVPELQAIVEESHLRSRLVGVHALATRSIANSLEAGVDMIIHCFFLDPDGRLRYDPRLGEMIATRAIPVNPTIYITRTHVEVLEAKRGTVGLTDTEARKLEESKVRADDFLGICRQLVAAGVQFIAGSDCGWGAYPFGQFHLELLAMEDAGLSAHQALLSSTRHAALAIGLADEIGTVEPGKQADLLAVQGDPSRDLSVLPNVAAVFQGGRRTNGPPRPCAAPVT
jgi:imidazolonepropionase-like amidohydrolase